MTPLRSREVKAFSEALEKIHAEMDLAQFPRRVFEILEEMIPDVVITMDEFDLRTGVARDAINRPPPDYAAWRSRLIEIVPIEHPIYHAIQSGHRQRMSVSEFLSDRQLRSTRLYSEVFKPIESRYQVVLPLLLPHHVAGITLNRSVNFSDTELALAELLAPHVALAHMHAQHYTALRGLQSQRAPEVDQLCAQGLTKREAEVLQWIIQGKRNNEIAAIIGASPRTVQKHVQRVLAKLGVETRTAAAVEAVRRSNPDTTGHTQNGL